MPTPTVGHPFVDIGAESLAPFLPKGPGHSQDPAAPPLLPLPAGSEEARHLLELVFGADHALRHDHGRVAAINLALAETLLRLTSSHEGETAALLTVRFGLALAQEEVAGGRPDRALAARRPAA